MNNFHYSLTVSQLQVLDSLLSTHSVSRTALELGLTQSAISHALSAIRTHYGDELLVRTGSGMNLTPFADGLKEPVRSVLRQIEDVSALREEFDPSQLRRACVVSARDLTASLFVPVLLQNFAKQAPYATLRIVTWDSAKLADQLAVGACDVAVGVDPPRDDPGLRIQKLYEDDYVAVCARRTAGGGELTLADFTRRQACVVSRTDRVGSPVDQALESMGLKRHIAFRSAYFLAALSVVADTDLLMVVPRRLAQKHAANFDLAVNALPFKLAPFSVCCVSHERFANSPLHKWLRELTTHAVCAGSPLQLQRN
jgi:DNA-binding transcriptional LysR family regulator